MKVYYTAIILVFTLAVIAQSRQRVLAPSKRGIARHDAWYTKNLFVWLVASVLIFVAGFRYQVGTDWEAYYFAENAGKYILRLSTAPFFEPGTGILAWIGILLYNGDGSLTFIAALVTISLYVRTIAKYSSMFALSILLYIFFGAWQGSFNGVRQYLAAAVLFAGHRFILDRQLGKWLVVVVIAGLFHTTAYVMVFWYFVAMRKLDNKQIMLMLLIAFVGMFSYDAIIDGIDLYKGKEIHLDNTYLTSEVNSLRIAVHWVPIIFFFFVRKYSRMDKETNFYANMVFLDAILMTAAMNSTYFARIGIYTGSLQFIAWSRFLRPFNIRDRRIVIFFMVLLYAVYWYIEVNGSSDLRLFRWLFDPVIAPILSSI